MTSVLCCSRAIVLCLNSRKNFFFFRSHSRNTVTRETRLARPLRFWPCNDGRFSSTVPANKNRNAEQSEASGSRPTCQCRGLLVLVAEGRNPAKTPAPAAAFSYHLHPPCLLSHHRTPRTLVHPRLCLRRAQVPSLILSYT